MTTWREMLRSLRWDATNDLQRFTVSDWLQMFSYNGNTYSLMPSYTLNGDAQEPPDPSFDSYVASLYKANAVVFACMDVRLKLFSEARFQYRQLRGGRPGDLFGTSELNVLETPWKNATTGDLLARAIQDADIAGNFYAVRQGGEIKRMKPDWVTIVLGSKMEPDEPGFALDAEIIGYLYEPGGSRSEYEPVALLPGQVAHFAPIPDPSARFRGMSWLTPVIDEIMGDNAATKFKQGFFQNGATPNLAVTADPSLDPDRFQKFVDLFKQKHADLEQVYKVMFLGGGADVKVVGSNLQQIDFKTTQGGGETRIAAAAGVPPVIAGLSEGLAAATYSNYQQSIRRFTDLTMRPLWRNMAGSLASIVAVPGGAELWYDDRDIPALYEDSKDAAEILNTQMQAIRTGTDGGYDPMSVVDAVTSGDLKRLKHTGLLSVQMQPPGAAQPDPQANGKPALPIGEPT